MAPAETLELVDDAGARLTYCLYGPPDGNPVVFNTGTPGSRYLARKWTRLMTRCGVRVLLYERPGYGESTRRPGRSVASAAADVARLADAQGWDRFATFGVSGGAAHALACAALLPDRVIRCASVVGVAPFDADGLDWFGEMSPGNVEEFTAAHAGEAPYREIVERISRQAVAALREGRPPIPDSYELDESDVAKAVEHLQAPDAIRPALEAYGSIDGWVDDGLAFTRPWGFDVEIIAVPTTVWYGVDDVLAPAAHAKWLCSRIPTAEGRPLPSGHFTSDETLTDLFCWLRDGTDSPGFVSANGQLNDTG